MTARFSISAMLQLTFWIALFFASFGLLPPLAGFRPGVSQIVFSFCLIGAFLPSLAISLFSFPSNSWYCWESTFISTIISSLTVFFLARNWCQLNAPYTQGAGLAEMGLCIGTFIQALFIASFTSLLTTCVQRYRRQEKASIALEQSAKRRARSQLRKSMKG